MSGKVERERSYERKGVTDLQNGVLAREIIYLCWVCNSLGFEENRMCLDEHKIIFLEMNPTVLRTPLKYLYIQLK